MKKTKLNITIRIIIVGSIIFTILYFSFFKTLKEKIDRQTIYDMYGANYSDTTLKWKIRLISKDNINKYKDLISVASASICNDNTSILELIDDKGGEFILQNLRSAYICEANNSINFLEKKGFSVFDNELQVPKYILSQAIEHGEYSEKYKKHLRAILDRNKKLKRNDILIGMVKKMKINESLPKTKKLRDELLSYFSDKNIEN